MSVSGVFLYCIKAFATLSVSREPVREILFIIIRLAVLTADSARPFDCGYDTDESLCLTPQLVRNCWNECAMNCGPPSLLNSEGIPYAMNSDLHVEISVAEVALWIGKW